MGTSHEILKNRINVCNLQIEYLMGMVQTYMSSSTQSEITAKLKEIEEDYYKPEEDEE
ncbi:MAG: hypothetical protein IJ759_06770 [Bacteroidales bacterium]|nr:hypothetical protein [Bacteroidales bacterium]